MTDLQFDPALLGIAVAGDLGPVTIYQTRRGRTVMFPRTKPSKAPSPAQNTQRYRFRLAMNAWWNLTPAQRAHYEDAVHRLSICMTGMNMWIHFCLVHRPDVLDTICNQSRLPLATPPEL